MSVWDWIYEYEYRLEDEENGESANHNLMNFFYQAQGLFDTNPEEALTHLTQGNLAAEQLKEPWWSIFYQHWQLQVILHHTPNYKQGLDLAVRAAVEVRKPIYKQLPQRLCVHEDLISAYNGTDPEGYEIEIESALKYMDEEVAEPDCRQCLQGLKTSFAFARERQDEARTEALRALASAEAHDSDHEKAGAHSYLCLAAFYDQEWEVILDLAKEGEILATRAKRPSTIVEFLAWQALAFRYLGDETEAIKFYRRAVAQMSRLGSTPDNTYFTIMTAFHERAGDLDQAREFRLQQIDLLTNMGQYYREIEANLENCRLLQLQGLTAELPAAVAKTRAVAENLRKPARYLEKLALYEAKLPEDKLE